MNWHIRFEPLSGIFKNALVEGTGWFCIQASIFHKGQEKFAERMKEFTGMFE